LGIGYFAYKKLFNVEIKNALLEYHKYKYLKNNAQLVVYNGKDKCYLLKKRNMKKLYDDIKKLFKDYSITIAAEEPLSPVKTNQYTVLRTRYEIHTNYHNLGRCLDEMVYRYPWVRIKDLHISSSGKSSYSINAKFTMEVYTME